MGNHRVAGAGPRAGNASQHATEAAASGLARPGRLTLQNWPVSTRLIAVIILALIMGMVFGGLQVASATTSAEEFGRVSQLARLGQQVADLVQALQVERDQTAGIATSGSPPPAEINGLASAYLATDAAAARVESLAAGIGGSFPTNIRARVAAVVSDIKDLPGLRVTAQASQSALAVIGSYNRPITDMIALDDQMGQGASDSVLISDVQTLNAMALAKDEAAQQRALLYNTFLHRAFADDVQQALITAQSGQLIDLTAFGTTATPAEQSEYDSVVAGTSSNDEAENIEIFVQGPDGLAAGLSALGIKQSQAAGVWYKAQSGTVDGMQQVELDVAQNIVTRATSLQSSAEDYAWFTAILVVAVLLLVLVATVAVARSLVGPLRRLREGALNIATVELPEQVRILGEVQEPSASLELKPIDVLSTDEIGQVARAFDQVHSEAVRLASNEAMLRNSFNAMFVNLSRRSQSLIERLARLIESLEQNEGDPERLSDLFSMDHLVTRMRRNSENLLLLAGHESARKWSEPVSLADVARAATSEIEQYSRVTLRIQPGIAVTGLAVSDVVHLLAEVIENATIYSARDTPVHVSAEALTTGGVLIEVADSGVGISEARLAEMNYRLDNPPVMDVSVSRHMGLFAVARLAERHGVRIRLRPRSPHGLTALIWLPDSVTERESRYGPRPGLITAQDGTWVPFRAALDLRAPGDWTDATVPIPSQADAGPRAPVPAVRAVTSDWFRARRQATAPPATAGAPFTVGAPFTAGAPFTVGAAIEPGVAWNGEPPTATPPTARGRRFETDAWAVGKHAAQIIAEPVRGESTAAGLPVRVPQANLLPGSLGGGGRGTAGRPAAGYDAPNSTAPNSTAPNSTAPRPRSPDLARSRLSGFQRGALRAKGDKARADQGVDS
jgi:signal transduction histidine kinase